MGTTGLVFGAVVVAWLAYLVPMWTRRSQQGVTPSIDLDERFSDSVRVVCDEPVADGAAVEHAVSTPLTRRARLAELKRRDQRAAGRRRASLIMVLLALVVVSGLAIARIIPVWTPAIPVGLLVLFVGAARISVQAMARERAAVLADLRGAVQQAEDTVVITAEDLEPMKTSGSSRVTQVSLGAPKPSGGGALWDAVPVTNPTYVQAPTPPRTVRTIDLSAPSTPKPVTADPKSATEVDDVAPVAEPWKKAVGE